MTSLNLQNRVDPWGEMRAVPSRGTLMGNRSILHDEGNKIVRPWAHKAWVTCLLKFNGIKRPKPFSPGNYSELFSIDEATVFAAGLPQLLRDKVEFSVTNENENNAMAVAAATRSLRRAERLTELEGLWEASNSDFVVADIETTGLDATVCEILEIAALLVNPAGVVLREFNVLVRAREEIPPFIVELTGISQILIDEHGVSEETAVLEFASFIGRMPIFFHNATFDTAFLAPALARHGLVFNNKVFDTLATARAAWPDLRSYKLATLAKIIDNAAVPTHRALADASATLSVLLAARELAGFGASSIEPGVMRDDLSLIANQGQLDNERV